MRRYTLYLAVGLLAFGIGSFLAVKFYLKSETKKTVNYIKVVDKNIEKVESMNAGFVELTGAKDGDLIRVQGFLDEKFLCHDVTDIQQNICTTVLIDSSSEKKSLLIRLQVCNEQVVSNCIVWKPNNLCPDNIPCSSKIKIYDDNSIPTELNGYSEKEGYRVHFSKTIQLKVTGKVSFVESKARLSTPIEHIEIIEKQ